MSMPRLPEPERVALVNLSARIDAATKDYEARRGEFERVLIEKEGDDRRRARRARNAECGKLRRAALLAIPVPSWDASGILAAREAAATAARGRVAAEATARSRYLKSLKAITEAREVELARFDAGQAPAIEPRTSLRLLALYVRQLVAEMDAIEQDQECDGLIPRPDYERHLANRMREIRDECRAILEGLLKFAPVAPSLRKAVPPLPGGAVVDRVAVAEATYEWLLEFSMFLDGLIPGRGAASEGDSSGPSGMVAEGPPAGADPEGGADVPGPVDVELGSTDHAPAASELWNMRTDTDRIASESPGPPHDGGASTSDPGHDPFGGSMFVAASDCRPAGGTARAGRPRKLESFISGRRDGSDAPDIVEQIQDFFVEITSRAGRWNGESLDEPGPGREQMPAATSGASSDTSTPAGAAVPADRRIPIGNRGQAGSICDDGGSGAGTVAPTTGRRRGQSLSSDEKSKYEKVLKIERKLNIPKNLPGKTTLLIEACKEKGVEVAPEELKKIHTWGYRHSK